MRNLLIMVGAPGSGKSTWIKNHNFEQYTICPDKLRTLMSNPVMQIDGSFKISMSNDHKVWKLVDSLIEERMKNGQFIIVDATHISKKYFSRYKKLCSKYRYRLNAVVFNIDIDIILKQNKQRPEYKHVPEEKIKLMNKRLEVLKIPSGVTCFNYNGDISSLNEYVRYDDVSNYDKIHVIGDIHGVYDPFSNFLKNKLIDSNDLFVFCGDYLDRGEDNKKVLEYLINICDMPNVIFLEGNHEAHLRKFSLNEKSKSWVFNAKTATEIEDISKKEIRKFCRKLRPFLSIKFNDKKFLITHGGVSNYNIDFINSNQLIKGVGKYEDYLKVSDSFYNSVIKNKENIYSIHGHRNTENSPIKINKYVYNLEGGIERKGELRTLLIDKNNIHEYSYKSDYLCDISQKPEKKILIIDSKYDNDIINKLNKNKLIIKKQLNENIISYNFSRKVFKKSIWNNQTIKARGLFVNSNTGDIVARSYDKFFNLNELDITKINSLKDYAYPVKKYEKENGYLGIIGYNKESDSVCYFSKTSDSSWHAIKLKEMAKNKEKEVYDIVKNGWSLIFECIDPIGDPHIIDYNKEHIVLLECIKNDFNYSQKTYNELIEISKLLDIKVKCIYKDIETYEDLKADISYSKTHFNEGYIYEFADKFKIKLKTDYYKKWKYLRGLTDRIKSNKYVELSNLHDSDSINFLSWAKKINIENKNIMQLRELYLKEKI